MDSMIIVCSRSHTGLPVIAESGGGMTNTGYAQVICGANGEKRKPLFTPRGYSNGEHALFVAHKGMCVIKASHDRTGESATVYRIESINDDTNEVLLKPLYGYENGDGDIPEKFQAAVNAALNKSKMYHCRSALYVLN